MILRPLVECLLSLAILPSFVAFAEDQVATRTEATPVVSLKVESLDNNVFNIGAVVFNKKERTLTVTATTRLRDQLVEYALVHESGKVHESLFTTISAPAQINLAFLLLGLGKQDFPVLPGHPVPIVPTNSVGISVTWETNGIITTRSLGELITLGDHKESPATISSQAWQYNGSFFDGSGFAAQRDGSIVSLIRDASALINNIGSDLDNDQVHHPKTKLLPPENWPVVVKFQLPVDPANELPKPPLLEPARIDKTNAIPLLQREPKSL